MLGKTVCAGGRLALRTSASRTLARASLLQPRDQLVAFQHMQGPSPSLYPFSNVRNYWWSKPKMSEGVGNPTELASQNTPDPVALPETATSPVPPEQAIASAQTEVAEVATSGSVSQVIPLDVSSSASEVVSNVVPPLQYGDFATLGLSGWSPSGIMSWSFELLQVSTGMPWFYTIIAGTLFWRAALIPTALSSIRNAARLRPFGEQIKALDEQAQGTKDRAAQMELMLKKQKLIEKAGVSLGSMFLPPIVQVVGNFGLFFAIKGMVQLPLVQLTQSGVWFLPDLTLTGDYIMPSLVLLVMNAQFSIMKTELDPTKPVMAHVMNVMRVASFATLPMMSWMPTGLWLSMLTGMLLAITQSSLLRVPRIRRALAIPPVAPAPPVTMRDTGKVIMEWYRTRMEAAAANDTAHQRKPNWTTLPKASRRAR